MPTDTPIDGRRLRREQGREAVITAAIDLQFEGHESASPEMVAARAGVSVASVFRYFESLDELRARAIDHYFTRFSHLFDVPDIGAGDRPSRIRSLVTARVTQHATTAPVARNVRREARRGETLGDALERLRDTQIDQLRLHFSEEIDALSPAAADDLLATIASLTSFESWDQFHSTSRRTDAQIRRAWTTALQRLLA